MSDLYAPVRAQALAQITKYGQAITWNQKQSAVADDASKPWNGKEAPPVIYTVSILFLTKGDNSPLLQFLTNKSVETSKLKGLMGAVSFTPDAQDTVTRDGIVLQITSIDSFAPNGTPILYTVNFKA